MERWGMKRKEDEERESEGEREEGRRKSLKSVFESHRIELAVYVSHLTTHSEVRESRIFSYLNTNLAMPAVALHFLFKTSAAKLQIINQCM
jgi:hypothetical protein